MRLKAGRAAIFVAGFALFSCGLPSYPALYAPDLLDGPISESEYEYVFGVPTDNNPDVFLGFELYYKLYTGVDVDEGAVDDDVQDIIDLSTLKSAGYVRMVLYSGSQPDDYIPLISLEDPQKVDENLQIIDFAPLFYSQNPSEYPNLIVDTESYSLARNVSKETGTVTKDSFLKANFSTDDGDVPSAYSASSANPREAVLCIALYLLSYGEDAVAYEYSIYSEPTYGGYIAILLPEL